LLKRSNQQKGKNMPEAKATHKGSHLFEDPPTQYPASMLPQTKRAKAAESDTAAILAELQELPPAALKAALLAGRKAVAGSRITRGV
jgi:hypothetical protein